MLRHEFQPGRLVAGACLLTAGVLFAGDAAGLWRVPCLALVPLVVGGLFLAGAVGMVASSVRRRRRATHRDVPPAGLRP
ncbi:hypothetical protein VM636_11780 [Streptomyces sp. SCSIO 75703]|uniref:hypothetical protein n=1 Tax=unclassified Streptomyces TaxID=2593676 RepID=UPI0004C09833|nr:MULTISPECIES: hypothetical protein [unclassified Streptomyces]